MNNALSTIWKWYLIPGIVLGSIKLIILLAWTAFWPIDALFGLSHNRPGFMASLVVMGLSLLNAALTIVAWPFVLYQLVTGHSDPWVTLFYPFMQMPISS